MKETIVINSCFKGLDKLLLYLFVIMMTNCTSKHDSKQEEADYQVFSINPDKIESSWDSIVQKSKIIPLEANETSLVNAIEKIIIDNDDIFVYDRMGKQVMLFDKSGIHISTINNIGRGPNEYLFLRDILYDQNNSLIGLVKQENNSILWYNKNGQFIKEYVSPIERDEFIIDNVYLYNNKIYHFNHNPQRNEDLFQINITNKQLSSIYKSYLPTNIGHLSNIHSHSFGVYNENLTFHYPNDPCLHIFNKEGLTKIFCFDFGSKNMPEQLKNEFKKSENFSDQNKIMQMNKKILPYVLPKKIVSLKNKIFLQLTYNFQMFYAIIDIESGSFNVFRQNYKDINFGSFIGSKKNENVLYFEISPQFSEEILKKNLLDEYSLSRQLQDTIDPNYLNSWILEITL